MNYFNLSEFCITPDPIPQDVADKILQNFIIPLNPIRHEMGMPIIISKKSGWRPEWWEKLKDRSGDSQHVFKGMGAADLVCDDMKLLGSNLAYKSPFMRLVYYPKKRFFHVDYALGTRGYYIDMSDGDGFKRTTLELFLKKIK